MKHLIRLSAEFNIKSPKVKAKFLRLLIRNIKGVLDKAGVSHRVEESWSRLYLHTQVDPSAYLSNVFGIGSFSKVEAVCGPDLEEMEPLCFRLYRDLVKDRSFCVRVKRYGVKGFTSTEAECRLGHRLGAVASKVDLSDPDVQVEVDVNASGAYFFSSRQLGPGGLPLGAQNRALCLISGGFDSAVAAWRMMRRGVPLDFLFCNLAGSAYEAAVITLVKALCERWHVGASSFMHVIDFNPAVKAIDQRIDPQFAQVVLKALFYQQASLLQKEIKASAIITGEAVGQVASQTLTNLAAINRFTDSLVVRPLVGFDKEEILKCARSIGTYVLSEHTKEYCALNNTRPVTRTSARSIELELARLPQKLSEELWATKQTKEVRKLELADYRSEEILSEEIPEGAVLVDTRDKASFDRWHPPGALYLPVQTLMRSFKSFHPEQGLVLLCDYGLQTAVIAEKMRAAGLNAVSYQGGVEKLKRKLNKDGKNS